MSRFIEVHENSRFPTKIYIDADKIIAMTPHRESTSLVCYGSRTYIVTESVETILQKIERIKTSLKPQ